MWEPYPRWLLGLIQKILLFSLFLIGNCTFANVSKGQVDTVLIAKIGVEIFDAFKEKSYNDYQQ